MTGRGEAGGGRADRLVLAAAAVVLLGLAVLAAGTAGPAPHDPGRPLVPVVPSATPGQPPPADDAAEQDPPDDTSAQLRLDVPVQDLVVAGVLIAGALMVLLLRRRRARGDAEPAAARGGGPRVGAGAAAGVRPLIDRALAAAEAELAPAAHREPRDAVVACWLRLEEGAAAAGVRRLPAQTPTEFTTALVAGLLPGEAERAALDELRRLYSRARFGSTPLDAGAPARAAAALGAVRAGLTAAGPVPRELAGGPPEAGR